MTVREMEDVKWELFRSGEESPFDPLLDPTKQDDFINV